MLDHAIVILRRALLEGAALFWQDISRDLLAGRRLESALEVTPNLDSYLREALRGVWSWGWSDCSDELTRLVKANPRRWNALDIQQNAAGEELPPSQYLSQAPLSLPGHWREYQPGASRTTAEWLAEHEANISRYAPREYVDKYLQQRLPPLANVSSEALKRAARDSVAGVVERGFSIKDSMTALGRDFETFSRWRLENIARTESAHCYEVGRLARYRSDPLVIGYEFHAVGDSRTSDICRWHDGRKYKVDDPATACPPLHFQCRSTLTPILFDEQPEWNDATPGAQERPLKGFGAIDEGLLPPNVGIAA